MKNEHNDTRTENNNIDGATRESTRSVNQSPGNTHERIAPHPVEKLQRTQLTKRPSLLLISVGSILTSMVAAGFLLGYGLDALLDTRPIFLLSFGVLGFIGGILRVYRILSNPALY